MASAIEAVQKKSCSCMGPILGDVFKVDFSHGAIHLKIYTFSCYI